MTYQHGLPFNQRVERKDKVKPSPPGSANQKAKEELEAKQESETREQMAASDLVFKKRTWLLRGEGAGGWGGGFCQTWAKQLLNAFQTCAQTHKRHLAA